MTEMRNIAAASALFLLGDTAKEALSNRHPGSWNHPKYLITMGDS
jgi:hypothetical protein